MFVFGLQVKELLSPSRLKILFLTKDTRRQGRVGCSKVGRDGSPLVKSPERTGTGQVTLVQVGETFYRAGRGSDIWIG